ncbi:MAG: flagellar biosynthetic protein FliR [Pseudomonadota bacterium]
MISALLDLHDIVMPLMTSSFVVFLRISGLMLLVPGLGDRLIPMRIRLVIAGALTVAVAPGLAPGPEITWPLALTEITIGLAFGAVLRILAQALMVAGVMAAQLTSLSQLFGTVEPSSAIGNLLNLAGLCLLMAAGLPSYIVEMLIRSYDVIPVGSIMPGADVVTWGVARMGHAFALAFALAAPFALAALLYNIAMGVVNRAMPQLMVALVGAPAITGASGVILLLAAPVMLLAWKGAMVALLQDPFGGLLP